MLLPLNLGFQVLASRRDPEKGEADHSRSSNEDVEDSPTNNESGSGSSERRDGDEGGYPTVLEYAEPEADEEEKDSTRLLV